MAEQATPAPVTKAEVEARDIERGPQEFNTLHDRRESYKEQIKSLEKDLDAARIANDRAEIKRTQAELRRQKDGLKEVIGFWNKTGARAVLDARNRLDRLEKDRHVSDTSKSAAQADLNQATLAFYDKAREVSHNMTREHDVDAAYDTATAEHDERNSQSKSDLDNILSDFSDIPEFFDDKLGSDSDSDSHTSMPPGNKPLMNWPQFAPETSTDSPEFPRFPSEAEPFQYDPEEGSLIPVSPPEPPDMPGKDVPALGATEPSDYGFRVEELPPGFTPEMIERYEKPQNIPKHYRRKQVSDLIPLPAQQSVENTQEEEKKRLEPLRTAIGRLQVKILQGRSYAGEKLGKSMSWLREWQEADRLTEKEKRTRNILGGVAIVGMASIGVFAFRNEITSNINAAGAGWDILGDNIGDAWNNFTGPETGTITGVDEGLTDTSPDNVPVEANASELPAPENFKDEHPWDWAVEAYGESNAMSELHKLSDKAAEAGHTVEWHGSGTNEWVEVDGVSKTEDVLTILRQYA